MNKEFGFDKPENAITNETILKYKAWKMVEFAQQ